MRRGIAVCLLASLLGGSGCVGLVMSTDSPSIKEKKQVCGLFMLCEAGLAVSMGLDGSNEGSALALAAMAAIDLSGYYYYHNWSPVSPAKCRRLLGWTMVVYASSLPFLTQDSDGGPAYGGWLAGAPLAIWGVSVIRGANRDIDGLQTPDAPRADITIGPGAIALVYRF